MIGTQYLSSFRELSGLFTRRVLFVYPNAHVQAVAHEDSYIISPTLGNSSMPNFDTKGPQLHALSRAGLQFFLLAECLQCGRREAVNPRLRLSDTPCPSELGSVD